MKIIIILPHKSLKGTCMEANLIYVCLQIKLKKKTMQKALK